MQAKTDQVTGYVVPKWAPRVQKQLIERLYRSTVTGIIDEEIVDEVGYALIARCESMLESTDIIRSARPICPLCHSRLAPRTYEPDERFSCSACNWKCPARMYTKTQSRKNLGTGGLDAELKTFIKSFTGVRDASRKLVLIDTLIHRFHWSSAQGRPLATALIEGKMKGTMAFLDRISYGDDVPEEARATRDQWRRTWGENGWSRGRGQ